MKVTLILLQSLLAVAGFYKGAIDGLIGPKTRAAMADAEKIAGFASPIYSTRVRRWVAIAQICLNRLGHEAGIVDGRLGHNTSEALISFTTKQAGNSTLVPRPPLAKRPAPEHLPRQKDLGSFYGEPGPQIQSRLKTIKLPFRLRIDYNVGQSTGRITLHEAVVESMHDAIIAVRAHYGADRWYSLGLDRYAGGYNHRHMRGGKSWSTHAYGVATDWRAGPNGLRTRCPEALFCKPVYSDFLDIMQDHNWLPAVRLWGADAMHFQAARL